MLSRSESWLWSTRSGRELSAAIGAVLDLEDLERGLGVTAGTEDCGDPLLLLVALFLRLTGEQLGLSSGTVNAACIGTTLVKRVDGVTGRMAEGEPKHSRTLWRCEMCKVLCNV